MRVYDFATFLKNSYFNFQFRFVLRILLPPVPQSLSGEFILLNRQIYHLLLKVCYYLNYLNSLADLVLRFYLFLANFLFQVIFLTLKLRVILQMWFIFIVWQDFYFIFKLILDFKTILPIRKLILLQGLWYFLFNLYVYFILKLNFWFIYFMFHSLNLFL